MNDADLSQLEHTSFTQPSSSLLAADSRLLRDLAALSREQPSARKRLVAPELNFGRELLRALALRTGGWIGWEPTSLRELARELAFVEMHARGVRAASDVEIAVLVNQAMENVRTSGKGEVSEQFADLERGMGFRSAVRDAVLELRVAGITPASLGSVARDGAPARDLAAVLEEYEELRREAGLVDAAELFALGLESFDREAEYVLDGITAIVPTVSARGLPRQLLERVLARGATVLSADAPRKIPLPASLAASLGDSGALVVNESPLACLAEPAGAPEGESHIDFFAAATPADELREALRRAVAEGLAWDEVEIATTDPDTYGVELEALCYELGIGSTMLRGVPLRRTRIGRAIECWFRWLEDGLPASRLRQALESGDLRSPDDAVAPSRLARRVRELRVGWGLARWQAAIERLEKGAVRPHRGEDESEREYAARSRALGECDAALLALLRRLLEQLPETPQRGSLDAVTTSASRLARATSGWLELVPLHGLAEERTAERLSNRLRQLAGAEDPAREFDAAMAILRDAISSVRAWPVPANNPAPWTSTGGMVHLTDISNAGATGRRRTFVVGLDADRVSSSASHDALLPDDVRAAAGNRALLGSSDRRAERDYRMRAALAGLRGRVTLSYATGGAGDGPESGPSLLLLQAFRLVKRDERLTYADVREALRPVGPARGQSHGAVDLDARDVWLGALARGSLLLDGGPAVRQAFPMLDAGLTAAAAARGNELSAFSGWLPELGGALDPGVNDAVLSASALETLSACPLAWFYKYGARIRLPDDAEYEAGRWLDHQQRGLLLHDVYESFCRTWQSRQKDILQEAAADSMRSIVDSTIARWRADVAPPGEAVFEEERSELHTAGMMFLELERDALREGISSRWLHLESSFGFDDASVHYDAADGIRLGVRGRIDRVDQLPGDGLVVIDYKTGTTVRYSRASKAAFEGGRQLQPALYAAVAEGLFDQEVVRFEYRFPTERGQGETIPYPRKELDAVGEIVSGLIEDVRAGAFVPTTDTNDCKFCDFRAICRVKSGESGWKLHSPRASWASEHAPGMEAYRNMLRRRAESGGEDDRK